MSKLPRVIQKIFGENGGVSQFGQFGSNAASPPGVNTKDLEQIQALSQYADGWFSATANAGEPPRIEDMNSLFLLLSSQIRYAFQSGVPEWDSATEYFADVSLVQEDGDIYVSLTGTDITPNVGNQPSLTEGTEWKFIIGKSSNEFVGTSEDLGSGKIEFVAGSIRQNATTRTNWDWIKDSGHEPVGVDDSTPAVASGSEITVNLNKTYSKVLTLICGADETLSNALGLTVGASVGLSSFVIKGNVDLTLAVELYYNGTSWAINYGAGQGGLPDNSINITSTSFTGSTLTIDHEWIGGLDVAVAGNTRGGSTLPYVPMIRNITDTSIELTFFDRDTGAAITAVDTSMSVILSKNFSAGIRMDGVDNGDALNLDTGNIWFFGAFLT